MESLSVPASLAWAHPVVQEWFVNRFGTPTEPQEQGWPKRFTNHSCTTGWAHARLAGTDNDSIYVF